jgi:hypothetical protein
MKVKGSIALYLRCIETDLRDYLTDPSDYTVDHIQDVYTLLLTVMENLGISTTPEGESE